MNPFQLPFIACFLSVFLNYGFLVNAQNTTVPSGTQAVSKAILATPTPELPDLSSCNGYKELCRREYDKVSYATTHNSFALSPNPAGNQNFPIQTQLQDGVRALMLDIHTSLSDPKVLELCHGDCNLLDAGPFVEGLKIVRQFLDNNPLEIITIFLENFAVVEAAQVAEAFTSADLVKYTKIQPLNAAWPTLQEMIRNNTRLVVFIDDQANYALYPWLLWEYDFVWETPYSIPVNSPYSCAIDRPKDVQKPMYVLNHFVFGQLNIGNGGFPIPAGSYAKITNEDQLREHAIQCQNERNQVPNFITVDFYDVGNVFQVVAEFNNVTYVPRPRSSNPPQSPSNNLASYTLPNHIGIIFSFLPLVLVL
ncbi:hypothetical protein K7432_010483 [Basidiobolus ranarum]|uniref:PLC-like phosphodiesterase n=1 Tax=Basidiobolus ranarum TaxID=34480 RepID=A0ABR2WNS2_9FUNG